MTEKKPNAHPCKADTKVKILAELEVSEDKVEQASEEAYKEKSFESFEKPELPFDDVEYNNLVAESCVSIFMIFNHSVL